RNTTGMRREGRSQVAHVLQLAQEPETVPDQRRGCGEPQDAQSEDPAPPGALVVDHRPGAEPQRAEHGEGDEKDMEGLQRHLVIPTCGARTESGSATRAGR